MSRTIPHSARLRRGPLLFFGLLSLLFGMAGGLVRLGWSLAPVPESAIDHHGALMCVAFLGTLIALERAVAAGRVWAYAGPLATGIGGIGLLLSGPSIWVRILLALGALALPAVVTYAFRAGRESWRILQMIGAWAFALGTLRWAVTSDVPSTVAWWEAFLLLTIAAERLELSRLRNPPASAKRVFAALASLLLLSLLLAEVDRNVGARLAGLSWIGLAGWLARYDLARLSLPRPGLPRFMAVSLLSGYAWLAFAGVLALFLGAASAGPSYDALLHAFFLGFVIAMIFAHAPVIFPSVLALAMSFRRRFYAHLALLQLGLVLRLTGDLSLALSPPGWAPGREWGGLLTVLAILLFLIQTVSALRFRNPTTRRCGSA